MAKLTHIEIENAVAERMCMGNWRFLGKLTNGLYFVAEEEDDCQELTRVRIVSKNPEASDGWDMTDWEETYFIKDLDEDEANSFFTNLLSWLLTNDPRCGIGFDALGVKLKVKIKEDGNDQRNIVEQICNRIPYSLLNGSVTVETIERDLKERPLDIIVSLLEM